MENKNHYYDGIIYDKFIAPNQDLMFRIFKSLIPENSSVLDVGTGTGRFPFQIANHCKYVVGLDLSRRNINLANKKKEKAGIENIEFIHGSITEIEKLTDKKFDFAVISYVLHEMPPEMRIEALRKMKSVSEKIIIGDYRVPLPTGSTGITVKVIEFLAGWDHFSNFRHFIKHGGIEGLAKQVNLNIEKTIKKVPTADVVVLS